MKKTIFAVMCETRQRGSEEPWENPYLVYCTDTIEDAIKDCKKFNQEENESNKIIERNYYWTKETLYTKD